MDYFLEIVLKHLTSLWVLRALTPTPHKKKRHCLHCEHFLFLFRRTLTDKSLQALKMLVRSLLRLGMRPVLALQVHTPTIIPTRYKAYKSVKIEPEMSVEEAKDILRSIPEDQRAHLLSQESIWEGIPRENELRSQLKAAKHRMLLLEHSEKASLREQQIREARRNKRFKKELKREAKREQQRLKAMEKKVRQEVEKTLLLEGVLDKMSPTHIRRRVQEQARSTLDTQNNDLADSSSSYWKNNGKSILAKIEEEALKKESQTKEAQRPEIRNETWKLAASRRTVFDGSEQISQSELFHNLCHMGNSALYYVFTRIIAERYPTLHYRAAGRVRDVFLSEDQERRIVQLYDLCHVTRSNKRADRKNTAATFEAHAGAIIQEDNHDFTRLHSWATEIFNNAVSTIILQQVAKALANINKTAGDSINREYRDYLVTAQHRLSQSLITTNPICPVNVFEDKFREHVTMDFEDGMFFDLDSLFKKIHELS